MIVQWSVDTVDWKGVSADTITNNVLGNSFPVVSYFNIQLRWTFARICRGARQNDSAVKNERSTFCNTSKHVSDIERAKVNAL